MNLIQPYTSDWKIQFKTIQKILSSTLDGLILGLEHVGSTSVPNLAAKAIIDMDIIYENDAVFPQLCDRLATLGYYHNGDQGVPQREAFKRKKTAKVHPILDTIPHHLYACPQDSPELKRHLLFRNLLRENEWARVKYTSIKMEIAAKTQQDKTAYSLLKESVATPFIDKVLVLAKGDSPI